MLSWDHSGKELIDNILRSSRTEVFCEKGVLKNFTKFTGKHLCQSLFFNKVAGSLLKKRLYHRCFPVNFAKFLRTPFLTELLRWLLLHSAQNFLRMVIKSSKVRQEQKILLFLCFLSASAKNLLFASGTRHWAVSRSSF